jgi:dephospho-CoA kinase
MLRIGITGGIGSGKSTVAAIFSSLGVPVYYADDAAKNLMNSDIELQNKIMAAFGKEVYKKNQLDRKLLASIVFNDKQKLELLNSLTHPATIADAEKWILTQTAPYIIKEAALLFESEAYKHLDKIIGVSAPEDLRVQRTMLRDNITADAVRKRMKQQMNEEEKIKRCDYVIYNDGIQPIIPQVITLHEKFLQLAKDLSQSKI